jgi:hypothetical protein
MPISFIVVLFIGVFFFGGLAFLQWRAAKKEQEQQKKK